MTGTLNREPNGTYTGTWTPENDGASYRLTIRYEAANKEASVDVVADKVKPVLSVVVPDDPTATGIYLDPNTTYPKAYKRHQKPKLYVSSTGVERVYSVTVAAAGTRIVSGRANGGLGAIACSTGMSGSAAASVVIHPGLRNAEAHETATTLINEGAGRLESLRPRASLLGDPCVTSDVNVLTEADGTVGTNGTRLFVGGSSGALHTYDVANSATWTAAGTPTSVSSMDSQPSMPTDTSSQIRAAPLFGSDGTIYTVSTTGRLSAWSPNGALVWDGALAPSGVTVAASPTIDCARGAAGTKVSGPGVLYVPATSGGLFAVDVDSNGFATTGAWPKFQHAPRNTGNSSTSLAEFACP